MTLRGRAGRSRRADGPVGRGQDDDPARDRRPRAATRRIARCRTSSASDQSPRHGAFAARRHGVSVPLPLRAPDGARQRLPGADARAARRPRAEAEAPGARAARRTGRRPPRDGACRASCPAARRSAWRSRARWRWIRRCCCSTSRRRRSIRRAGASLGAALRRSAGAAAPCSLTSHDDDFVRDHATRVVVLADGRVVETGEPRAVLDDAGARGDARAAPGRATGSANLRTALL